MCFEIDKQGKVKVYPLKISFQTVNDLQNNIDRMQKSYDGSEELPYIVPIKIERVCFVNENQNFRLLGEKYSEYRKLEGIDIEVKKTFTDFEYPIEGEEDNLCERDEEFMKIEPIINKEIADEDAQKLYEQNPGLEQFVKDIKDHPQIAFPCRFEELHFNAGPTLMDGETALKYARSRHATEDGGDFNRALRQQNVLEAVKKKVLAIEFIPKIIPLLDDLEKHIITDLPLSDLNKLLLEARNSNQYSMDTLVLTDEFLTDGYSSYGGYIVYPKEGIDKWGKIQKTIQNMQQGITPSPAGEETAAPLKD